MLIPVFDESTVARQTEIHRWRHNQRSGHDEHETNKLPLTFDDEVRQRQRWHDLILWTTTGYWLFNADAY